MTEVVSQFYSLLQVESLRLVDSLNILAKLGVLILNILWVSRLKIRIYRQTQFLFEGIPIAIWIAPEAIERPSVLFYP